MKPSLLSRSLHKWLALFVGVQLLIWAITGFYMVAIDLDFIHGDPLVRNVRTPVGSTAAALPVSQLTSRYPEITLVSLHSLPVLSSPVYELTAAGRRVLVQMLEHEVPMDVRGRAPPLWRADFDDWLQTTLYVHPDTGALVARRHRLWRWYDFLWMLHIMDYGERETPTGVVPRVATVLGAVTVVSGVWMLYFSFWRPRMVGR